MRAVKATISLYVEGALMARDTQDIPDEFDHIRVLMEGIAAKHTELCRGRPWYAEIELFDNSDRRLKKLLIEETPSAEGYFVSEMMVPPIDEQTKAPGFWTNEQSGALRPVVESFLRGHHLTERDIATMRAYLRQWIYAPAWAPGPELDTLRKTVPLIQTEGALKVWLEKALEIGIDPL